MSAPARLRHDPDDQEHRLYCSNSACWEKRAKFRLGGSVVGLELAASSIMTVVLPDGYTYQEFKKGEVKVVGPTAGGS
jgi:hypothetical protein